MSKAIYIVGVHPVEADEPVHLIEIALAGSVGNFSFGAVTQESPGQPESNWQVAYDEQELSQSGNESRYVFFFHYLDFTRPLLTSMGPVPIPKPTPRPEHLHHIEYFQP
jgi:hypothetical protein